MGGDRQLRIFSFRHHGSLVGIIPVFFETIWLGPVYVRTVKLLGTDFTLAQVCLPVETTFLPPVMERFFAELDSISPWDAVCLGPLSGRYRDVDELHQTCCRIASEQARPWHVNQLSGGVQTYFALGASWQEYHAGLPKRTRDDIRYSYKMLRQTLAADASEISLQAAGIETFSTMFADFVRMHQIQWKELGKLGHFGDWPGSEAFHREVAHAQLLRGRLRLQMLKLNDCCLGYEYCYAFGGNYLNFSGARSTAPLFARISMGKIVFSEMVKSAIAEGSGCIDSLQGKYEYKLRLGGQLLPIHRLRVVSARRLAWLRLGVFRFLAKALDLCYYRIWFLRLAPRLPFPRGPLWKIWMRTRMY